MSLEVQAKNPYDYQSPITDAERFLGRSFQLTRSREIIANRACVSFVGEPRCGLTSLLHRLSAEDFRARCEESTGRLAFVHIDCTQFDDPVALMRYIMAHIAPNQVVPNLPHWRLIFPLLIGTLDQMVDQRVVLLFDDFEYMGSNENFVEFTDRFRALTQRANMSLITTTHTELKKCCHIDIAESPFPNMFQVEYLGPFTQEETSEFLCASAKLSEFDLSPYIENIAKLGGRFPYFLQMALWIYHERLAQGQDLDDEVVDEEFLQMAQADLTRIWERLDETERNALCRLAEGTATVNTCKSLADKGYVIEDRIFSTAFTSYIKRVK